MYYTIDEKTNNYARVSGEVVSTPMKSHQIENEWFYEFKVAVERLSKIKDIIPFTVSERTLSNLNIKEGSFVDAVGEYRSYNKLLNEHSTLVLHMFVKEIKVLEEKCDCLNEVSLTGFLCKAPIYRKTPFDREICDVLLAVNRTSFHKSDYIPCILWGRNARFIAEQKIGCKVSITGRIQSREYSKQLSDGKFENKTAYEVSCQRISILSNVANIDACETETDKVVN